MSGHGSMLATVEGEAGPLEAGPVRVGRMVLLMKQLAVRGPRAVGAQLARHRPATLRSRSADSSKTTTGARVVVGVAARSMECRFVRVDVVAGGGQPVAAWLLSHMGKIARSGIEKQPKRGPVDADRIHAQSWERTRVRRSCAGAGWIAARGKTESQETEAEKLLRHCWNPPKSSPRPRRRFASAAEQSHDGDSGHIALLSSTPWWSR